MASSSSSSSSRRYPEHEVFLSFRGEDTRINFTSHLMSQLRYKSIKTFIDDYMWPGDRIAMGLEDAIRSSLISVVILSANYATSSWCLDEVVLILECMRERGQVVIPVFYEVDPSHVRKQSESYEAAFDVLNHSMRFGVKKVNQWRSALTQIANISGFHSQKYRNESELIEAIVKDIVRRLNGMSVIDDFKNLVGIEKSYTEMINLLGIDLFDVRMIGIWGMGGMGKTTLARVIFERISSNFKGSFFLENVRKESLKQELGDLRKKLVADLLDEKDLNDITTSHKDRLRRKKVLIVLDDVDQAEQLDELARDSKWFGDGSRIIITTRDDQVLKGRVTGKYELKSLDSEHSLELFRLKAFERDYSPNSSDIDFSNQVVKYANGLPLVLTVLGASLRSKKRENWDGELTKLKRLPNKIIHAALKTSYDSLDEEQQRVFLDITCLSEIGERTCKHYLERQLGGDRSVESELDTIISKSLIIEQHDYLKMHDLVREMGREIVRQECTKEPGKRSRLWTEEDCCHVLNNKTGTISIEGISMMYFHNKIQVGPAMLDQMHRLRFLKLSNVLVQNPLQLDSLPSSLKYLEWQNWPFDSLPKHFIPRNLVELRMPHSNLKELWSTVDQDLENLKYVDLSYSAHLIEVSALAQAPNLESVDLTKCIRLRQVPSLRFGDLGQSYHKCDYKKCSTLGSLNLKGCNNVLLLSSINGNVTRLDLSGILIKELPSSVTSLRNLVSLELKSCQLLKNLPGDIENLQSLKHLDLGYCSSFATFPVLPANMTQLNLRGTAIEQVPSESIKCLSMLEELDLSSCTRLKYVPTSLCKLTSLKRLLLDRCYRLEIFTDILEPMPALEILSLRRTGIRGLPFSIGNLNGLQNLYASLLSFRDSMEMEIEREKERKRYVKRYLTSLDLSFCKISEIPREICKLRSLQELCLSGNPIHEIPLGIQELCNLKTLQVLECKILKSLPELPESVEHVNACGCRSLQTVSASRDKFEPEPWSTEDPVNRSTKFLYYNCPLDEKTHTMIVEEFQLRVLRTATTIVSDNDESKELGCLDVVTFLLGNKIPRWFAYHSETSIVNVKLPEQWYRADFMGFAFCVVVALEHEKPNGSRDFDLLCDFDFKTKDGKSSTFKWHFSESVNGGQDLDTAGGSNMLMWYKYENYRDCRDAIEVSLHFSMEFRRNNFIVTACGVRLLYGQDQ